MKMRPIGAELRDLFAGRIRNMRIYDGPSEVHRMVVARNLMDTRP